MSSTPEGSSASSAKAARASVESRPKQPPTCLECRNRRVKCGWGGEPGVGPCVICTKLGKPCAGAAPRSNPRPGSLKNRAKRGMRIERIRTILEGAPLADSSALVNLAPSSTGSRLVLDELGGALMYSLIQSANDSTDFKAVGAEAFGMKVEFAKLGFRASGFSGTAEVRLASLVAYGGRRTSHSAITGTYNISTTAGVAREGPCRRLVDHAVEVADALGVLVRPSLDNLELLEFLSLLLHANAPGHPKGGTFILAMHRTRSRLLRDERLSEEERGFLYEHDIVAVPYKDARRALEEGNHCLLMLEELRLEYSWTFARAKDSLHTLTALASQPVWNSHEVDSYVVFDLIYDVFLGLQRAVITLRDTGLYWPIDRLQTFISSLGATVDEMWDFFDRAMAKVLAPSSAALRDAGWEMTITRQRHHFGIILFYTSEIIRRLSGSVWDPRIHRQALRSLKLIATSQPCTLAGEKDMHPATLHNLAYRMLDVSDSPGWQELARAGVEQSLSGQGFLSDVGFTLEHVRLLRAAFERSTFIFAAVREGVAALESILADPSGSSRSSSSGYPESFDSRTGRSIAETLVELALEDVVT